MRKSGVYLVTEPGFLNMESGAFHHINTGFNELTKQFKLSFFVKTSKVQLENSGFKSTLKTSKGANSRNSKGSRLKGSIKDVITLFKNLAHTPELIQNLKKENAYIYILGVCMVSTVSHGLCLYLWC